MSATFNAKPLASQAGRQHVSRPAAASAGGASPSGDVSAAAAINAHEAAADPHPQYETAPEVIAKIDAHSAATDPHADRAFATAADAAHVAAVDPHGDRAFATALMATHNSTADVHQISDVAGLQNELDLAPFESTGTVTGFALSIFSSTQVAIGAGTAIFVAFTPDPAAPVQTKVVYPGANVTITGIAGQIVTYLGINASGTIVQQATPFTPLQRRSIATLGTAVHVNLTSLNAVVARIASLHATGNQLHDLLDAIGSLNTAGNVYGPNGANLNLNRSSGNVFKFGVNNNYDDPHNLLIAGMTAGSFFYHTSTGTIVGPVSTINVTQYESAPGVLSTVSNNRFSIQRIYLFTTGVTRIQYGTAEYQTMEDAEAALQTEAFTAEPTAAAEGILRAHMIVKKNATAANNAADVKFFTTGKFGSVATGGTALTLANIVAALGYTPVNKAGDTMTGALLVTPASGTSASVIQTATGAANANHILDRVAGMAANWVARTAGLIRWVMGANGAAESGSNAGSDFQIARYNDAGTHVGTPLTITRSTGVVAVNEGLNVSGRQTLQSAVYPWAADIASIDIGGTGGQRSAVVSYSPLGDTWIASGTYYDGAAFRAKSAGTGGIYSVDTLGSHRWFSLSSALAGAVQTALPTMTLTAGGQLGLGNGVTPTRALTIYGSGAFTAAAGAAIRLDNATSARFSLIDFSDDQFLNIWSSDTGAGGTRFLRGTGGGVESMRINTDGKVCIGTTAPITPGTTTRGHLTVSGSADAMVAVGIGATRRAYVYAGATAGSFGSDTTVTLDTAGNARFWLNAAGNARLDNATPNPWSGFTAFEVPNGAIFSDGSSGMRMMHNGYYDGSAWRFAGTGSSSRFELKGGGAYWYGHGSGTAGGASSPTERMQLNTNGNLGIGLVPGIARFSVYGGSLDNGTGGLSISGGLTAGRLASAALADLYSVHTYQDSSIVEMSAGSSNGSVTGIAMYGGGASNNANSIRLISGSGTGHAILDSRGNFGVGAPQVAWTSLYKALQIGDSGALWSQVGAVNATYLTTNQWYDGGAWQQMNPSYGGAGYLQNAGAHSWSNWAAGSGTQVERMYLSAAGNLGVGTNSFGLAAAGRTILAVAATTLPLLELQAGGATRGAVSADTSSNVEVFANGGAITLTSGAATLRLQANGGVFIANASTPAAPTGGGIIYVEAGALKYRGSSGTVTVLAPA